MPGLVGIKTPLLFGCQLTPLSWKKRPLSVALSEAGPGENECPPKAFPTAAVAGEEGWMAHSANEGHVATVVVEEEAEEEVVVVVVDEGQEKGRRKL